jgi:ketosteroid isomerase-like protein
MIAIPAIMTSINHVLAGGSVKDAASKATFEMTHEARGEINLRREARAKHAQAVAGLYSHPLATLVKAGTEAAGYQTWY